MTRTHKHASKRCIVIGAGSRHTWIAVVPDSSARLAAGVGVAVADVWRVAHDVGAVAQVVRVQAAQVVAVDARGWRAGGGRV